MGITKKQRSPMIKTAERKWASANIDGPCVAATSERKESAPEATTFQERSRADDLSSERRKAPAQRSAQKRRMRSTRPGFCLVQAGRADRRRADAPDPIHRP